MNNRSITLFNDYKVKAFISGLPPIEPAARQQLINLSNLPFIHKHVAAMPDVHMGKGAAVGSVVVTKKAIIPAAAGVDLGCGMLAVRLSLTASDLPDNLDAIRSAIEAAVPHGRTDNGGANDKGAFQLGAHNFDGSYPYSALVDAYNAITERHPKAANRNNALIRHLGTLGTGNHFIELCLDEEQRVWVMLHSGSRGLGNRFGSYFIEKAKQDMERWFINLPDKDLAYIPEGSELFDDYMAAVEMAQQWALLNREVMMEATLNAIAEHLPPFHKVKAAVNCHHNYISREHHFGSNVLVTRKGAVRAREGDLGIIPGSMGAKSFIVRGKGNEQSFHSCSHGAGRVMSRTAAKKTITMEQHKKALAGVNCRNDESTLDESPAAYKDIDAVMAAQSELVDIVHTLRQVVCVKG